MRIYIDGDYILYLIAARMQPTFYGVNDEWFNSKKEAVEAASEACVDPINITKLPCMMPPTLLPTYCEQAVDRLNASLKSRFGDDSHIIWGLSDEDNFRKELYPEYKANRGEKPIYLPYIKRLVEEYTNSIKVPFMEMDDVIGQLVYQDKEPNIVVSVDKDLANLPTTLYNPSKNTVKDITPAQGLKTFLIQVVTGDTVDNIKGVPGLGLVAATSIVPKIGAKFDPREVYEEFLVNLFNVAKEKNKQLDMEKVLLDIVLLDVGGYYHKLLGLKHPNNGKHMARCRNYVTNLLNNLRR